MRPASACLAVTFTFALGLGTSAACSKKGDSATTHIAALGRELQAFGQNGDVPASAAHREWLIDHIGWNELIGVFIGDVLSQAQPEQRQDAMHAFQIDINEPSDNTMFRRRRSLMRLSIAAGNGKCKVIKASADDKGIWDGGDILDPNNGKVYRLRMKPLDGGKALEVRGYIGPFFRNQQWIRVE